MAHKIHLTFSDGDGQALVKGPYSQVCFQGETIRERSGDAAFATHEDHQWEVDGKRFVRFDCDCRVLVHATRIDGRRTQSYGPFDSFSAQDGVLFVNHHIFAFADRSLGDWYCHGDGFHWAVLTVEPAN